MTNACRKDFPLLMAQDIAYLDNAATAQRPQCVLDAVRRFYCEQNANPLRGLYPLSIAATDAYENAREAVRRFLNAKSTAEIVFTRNTTEGLNLVAYSYGLSHIRAGDEVVVSILEHHSDLLPWQMVCRQTGAALKFLECEPDGSLDLNRAEAVITGKTKLVAVTHVSNVIGRVNPIRQLADIAHRHGAVIVVDGAQGTPHIPVDVQALDADFLAFSGHKVYGPMGIGVLYGKRALLDELCQNLCDNAIRYNRPGGKVQITTACSRDGHCTLTVADNGIGIPKEAQSSVFERFYRVDKSRSKATGGTGLGLAIVKHIARIHNARIKLESQVDVGTTITVTFPTAN